MKTTALTLAALVALSSPAGAEPDNPGAAEHLAAEGHVRTPATPGDRRMVGLRGEAATLWNGEPIWKLLIYCGAMHSARRQLLIVEGAPGRLVDEQDRLASRYRDMGATRFAADRGLSVEAASGAITAEDAYWTYFFRRRSFAYTADSRTCDDAAARDRRGR